MSAKYTQKKVKIDGKLNDTAWKNAKTYQLQLSKEDKLNGQILRQGGTVRAAWDKKYFYLAAEFTDSDVIAEGKKNQMHHYKYGDLCELFLKSAKSPHYWELYATPLNKKTTFFFPSKGYLGLQSCFENYIFDLKVASKVYGTVNNYNDKDEKWTAEMAVPIKELERFGDKFQTDSNWRILIGRYNYSLDLIPKELTMYPSLSVTNFHTLNEYAVLKLEK
jgi:hypothetical protein